MAEKINRYDKSNKIHDYAQDNKPERLRYFATRTRGSFSILLWDAADEIERLRRRTDFIDDELARLDPDTYDNEPPLQLTEGGGDG
jgi:hypothetical protein